MLILTHVLLPHPLGGTKATYLLSPDDYILIEHLGHGAFGEVYLVVRKLGKIFRHIRNYLPPSPPLCVSLYRIKKGLHTARPRLISSQFPARCDSREVRDEGRRQAHDLAMQAREPDRLGAAGTQAESAPVHS